MPSFGEAQEWDISPGNPRYERDGEWLRVAERLLWRMKYCLSSIIAATIAIATTAATTTITTATATITATIYVTPIHVSSISSFFLVLPLITTILLIVPEQAHSTAAVTEHRC
uniref:PGG domain-containing protein n=1 Tax=Setaria digitata TaxID=48799 RepID=A0A915PTH6_9BILA